MKLGILSDTHNRLPTLRQAFELFDSRGVEAVVHCGDWTTVNTMVLCANISDSLKIPVMGVLGNRDDQPVLFEAAQKTSIKISGNCELLTFSIDGQRFIAYHGHHKPTLRKLRESTEYDVLFTGHTHKPLIQSIGAKCIINPGSTAFSIPRRRESRSVALYDTVTQQAELLFYEPSQ